MMRAAALIPIKRVEHSAVSWLTTRKHFPGDAAWICPQCKIVQFSLQGARKARAGAPSGAAAG
jgi:hypothetical protein